MDACMHIHCLARVKSGALPGLYDHVTQKLKAAPKKDDVLHSDLPETQQLSKPWV
jgi:hypothetical protein